MNTATLPPHEIVSHPEWTARRRALLAQEKALTRSYDALRAQRLALPWVKLDKTYVFEGPGGPVTLAELFAGRSQLIIQHFMLGPGWEEGCVGCSFGADHTAPAVVHLEHHDVSFVVVSRAPLAEITPFHRRMGWPFRWVSSHGSDFNHDFHVSFTPEEMARGQVNYNYETQPAVCEELPGFSVFARSDAGEIYHTYSAYARGMEPILTTYVLLDVAPLGRNENGPNHALTDWVRHHDRYEAHGHVAPTGRYVSADAR